MASDEEPVLEDRRADRCPRFFQESTTLYDDAAASEDSSLLSARSSSHSAPGPAEAELDAWSAGRERAGQPQDAVTSSSEAAAGCPSLAQKPLAVRGLLCGAAAPDSDDSTDEETRCAVCFMQMVHPVRLPCNHVFCFLCVKGVAITSSPRCALCRHPIPPDFLLRPTLVMIPAPQRRSHTPSSSSSMVWCHGAPDPPFPAPAADKRDAVTDHQGAKTTCQMETTCQPETPCQMEATCQLETTCQLDRQASPNSPAKSAAHETSDQTKPLPLGPGVNYQWFYEGRNGWWKYDERTNKEIEAAYQAEESTCQVMVVGLVFVVDFTRMLQYRIKDPTKRRKIKRDVSSAPMKGIAGISVKRLDGVEEDGPDPAEGAHLVDQPVRDGAPYNQPSVRDVAPYMPLNQPPVRDGAPYLPLNSDPGPFRHRIPSGDRSSDRLDASVRSRLTDVASYQSDYVPPVVLPQPAWQQEPLEEFHLPDDLSDDAGSDPAVDTVRHTLERLQLVRYPACHRGEEELQCCQCCRCAHHRSLRVPRACYCQHQGSPALLQPDAADVSASCECSRSCAQPSSCASCTLNCPHVCETSSTPSSSSLLGSRHSRCCQRPRGCTACCRLTENTDRIARTGAGHSQVGGSYHHAVPPVQDRQPRAGVLHADLCGGPLHIGGQPCSVPAPGFPAHLDSQSRGVSSHLSGPSHAVPSHLISQSLAVSSHLGSQSHAVSSHLGSPSFVASSHLDTQSHAVSSYLDGQSHGEPSYLDSQPPAVSSYLDDQSHEVPLHLDSQAHGQPPPLLSYVPTPPPGEPIAGVPTHPSHAADAGSALEGRPDVDVPSAHQGLQ